MASMEMTGHGWRCSACMLKLQHAAVAGQAPSMAEHLTLDELRGVVRAGGREAVVGVVVVALGLVLGYFAMSISLRGFLGSFVVIAMGAGALAQGLYRRRQALRAIGEAPSARIVRR